MLSLMHVRPVVCYVGTVVVVFFTCPNPKRIESYLRDTIEFSASIQDGDLVCYSCYKFFNQMLKSDVCMLASKDIVLELKAKKENLENITHE